MQKTGDTETYAPVARPIGRVRRMAITSPMDRAPMDVSDVATEPQRHLLDFDDDTLITIATHLSDAADRCCLAITCQFFSRLILRDAEGTIWAPLVNKLIPNARSSIAMYRTLSTVRTVRWEQPALKVARMSAANFHSQFEGLSGAAMCQLGQHILFHGGTQNGNAGPVSGALMRLDYDAESGELTAWPTNVTYLSDVKTSFNVRLDFNSESHELLPTISASSANVAPTLENVRRRGHSLTATNYLRTADGGTQLALLIGGWGYIDIDMNPMLLKEGTNEEQEKGYQYSWSKPETNGALPAARAFHSATEVSEGLILVYGGLGRGRCCNDVCIFDVAKMTWFTSAISVGGAPRCVGGRAGHGACYFPRPGGGGDLLLISGASRSSDGDAHQGSVDVLEVTPFGDHSIGDPNSANFIHEGLSTSFVHLEWSHDRAWGNILLPEVRTGTYVTFAKSVMCWSGIGEGHAPADTLHVIDVERKTVREAVVEGERPLPRGGAVAAMLSPFEALVFTGNDHENEEEMVAPHVMKLVLPE